MSTVPRKHKKVGLALGGGGAKGLAHIGVIKELERAGLEISAIAGTSMGAIVGSWYAATKDVTALEKLFLPLKSKDVFPMYRLVSKRDGRIFKDDRVPNFIESNLDGLSFDKLKIPFRAVATDVKDGTEVVLSEGRVADAVRASSSLPIISNPVSIDGRLLMDGGFVNPVPADVVRAMGCDFVIAVDVSSKWLDFSEEKIGIFNVYSLVMGTLATVEYQIARRVLVSADMVLKPAVMHHDLLAFGSAKDIIRHGESEAHAHISTICEHVGHIMPAKSAFDEFMDFILYAD